MEGRKDKNMIIPETQGEQLTYTGILSGVFEISGFPWSESTGPFCRLDKNTLAESSEGIRRLATHTSGGILRFASNSPLLGVKVELTSGEDMSHMPRSGSSGIDIYIGKGAKKTFYKTAMPETCGQTEYEVLYKDYRGGLNEWTINFPLYNGIKNIQIGLSPDSVFLRSSPYTIKKPIVFYGSSITQGACASRPGNAYTHLLCRWLDAGMVNLGFSGGASGDEAMAHLIASLQMSLFVMDYDHNAPDVKHLEATHEKFFKIIRNSQPGLPVIIITRPDTDFEPAACTERRNMIYRTYANAVDNGDMNVFFIDGKNLFGIDNRDACTVDECHPNDLGFMRMAEFIYPTAKHILYTAV
jgi:lysophospholipase L1-like esterase